MKRKRPNRPRIKIVKKGKVPLQLDFKCPVCKNPICIILEENKKDIKELYCDAADEGDRKIRCGVCDTIIEWFPDQPKNPSRRK